MRIALIGRRFDPSGGGTERDLIVTARILAQAGHEIRIYAEDVRGAWTESPVARVRTAAVGRSLRFLGFAAKASAVARREGAELVVSFARVLEADILRSGGSAHESYLAAARAWQSSLGRAAMRLSPYERIQVMVERRSFRASRLRRVIAVSQLVRDDLIDRFGLDPALPAVLYNGVDLERFQPQLRDSRGASIRTELGLPQDAPVVTFVGNGFARKGLGFLIRAWKDVVGRALLVVAGTDGAAARYRRLARRLGIGERVRFLGAYGQIEQLFAAADALVLPSLFEPFGNVVLEAMAAGLPASCSAACGAAEALPAAMKDLVVRDPTDLSELTTRVNTLIERSADLRRVARAAAERFTWTEHAERLQRLIMNS